MNQFFHWIQIRRKKRIKIIVNQNGYLIKKIYNRYNLYLTVSED